MSLCLSVVPERVCLSHVGMSAAHTYMLADLHMTRVSLADLHMTRVCRFRLQVQDSSDQDQEVETNNQNVHWRLSERCQWRTTCS